MRLLVTGGAGFIGSHVADAALGLDWEVLCVDDLSTGLKENLPKGAVFAEADIRDSDQLSKIFKDFRPNSVSHQAAQASVPSSRRDPVNDASVNVIGSLQVLQAARNFEVERLVAASTGGAIYGDVPDGDYATEEAEPKPISPYGVAKLSMEFYMRVYRDKYGLKTHTLRYANVYGERQNATGEAGVVAIFSHQIAMRAKLKLHARISPGDRGCIRDYIHVSDVVRANMIALAGRLPRTSMNVCTGVETTTGTLLEEIEHIVGWGAKVEPSAPRPGDVQRSAMSNAICQQYLNQTIPLAEGLKLTVPWFQRRLAAGSDS
jgi:UDP-glucose 4-epimerase